LGRALGAAVMNPGIEAIDPLGKCLGWQSGSASRLGSAVVGPPGRRLATLFSGGLARSLFSGEVLIEGGLLKGSAPPTMRKVWSSGRRCRRRDGVGDREHFEGIGERSSQPRHLALVHDCDGRRRGRLGSEAAVSVLQEVSVRSGWGRVVSSSLLVNGSRTNVRAPQGSLSNYRLKLTVRGRSVAESRLRSRTAA